MKTLLIAFLLISGQAMAADFRCEADFIVPKDESETELTTMTVVMTVTEKNGQRISTVVADGQDLFGEQEVTVEDQKAPVLDMVQQLKDFSQEDAEYGKMVEELYGDKVDRLLKETKNTVFEGFEADDVGAILGHHYDVNGKLIATEISIAWLATAICK